MDKNYLNQLWAWTNSQDPTFKDRYTFDSWSQKLSSDEAYKQKFYGWVSGIDNTFQERRPYETWSGLVTVSDKKKEESALPSREEGTSLATPKMAGPKPLVFSFTPPNKNPLGRPAVEAVREPPKYTPFAQAVQQKPISKAKTPEAQKIEKEIALNNAKKDLFKDAVVNTNDLITVQDRGISKSRDFDAVSKKAGMLQQKYGDLGFTFKPNESSFVGEDISVVADDGSSVGINLFSTKDQADPEAKKLQAFLFSRSGGNEKRELTPYETLIYSKGGDYENISKQAYDRIFTDENIIKSINFLAEESNDKKEALSSARKELESLRIERDKLILSNPEEYNNKEEEYNSKVKIYEAKASGLKSSALIADKAVKNVMAERLKREAEKGNVMSASYNSLVTGFENLAKGIMYDMYEGEDILRSAIGQMDLTDKQNKVAQEKYMSGLISSYADKIKARGVSEEYLQSTSTLNNVLFSLAETIPLMLISGPLSQVTMQIQGVGRRMNEYEKSPEMQALMPREDAFLLNNMKSLIETKLEKVGMTQALSRSGLANSLLIKSLQKWAPSMGNKALYAIVNSEVNNVAAKVGLNTAGAFIAEFETGGLQNIMETSINELYNAAKEKEVFKQPKVFTDQWVENVIEDATMEGLGGLIMGGASNIAKYTYEGVLGKMVDNEQFKIVKNMLKDGVTYDAMVMDLKSKIVKGEVSMEDAQRQMSMFKNAQSIVEQMPDDISIDQQRKAYDLITERKKLEREIAGKDPNLVSKKKNRINEINNQLKSISENAVQEQATSEVPVQPEAGTGEEVAQGEPQAGVEVATEEGVKEGTKEVVSGVEITYPSEQQKQERKEARNRPEYVEEASKDLQEEDVDTLSSELSEEFGILTAENPMAQPLTEEENKQLNQKAEEWLKSKGYKPKRVTGKYDQAENSFFVPGLTVEDAIEFAKEFNQESVAHSTGLVKQDGSMNPRMNSDDNFSFEDFTPESNYVSVVKTKDGLKTFQVGYDFNTTVDSKKPSAQPVQQAVAQNIQETDENYQESRDAVMQIAQDQKEFVPGDAVLEQVTTDDKGNVTGGVVTFLDADRNPTRKTISRAQTAPAKTGIVENVKKAISKLFPKLEAKNFNSASEMREYARSKHGDAVANQVQDDDAARVLLDQNNEPIAILVNDQLSDETTLPHEAWHPIMLKAFGDNQKLFSQFRAQIKKALIDNGFKDIADQLDAFANQEEYKKTGVDAEEWLVQFGALLTNKKIDANKLTPKQKSLIEKLRDIINSFMSKVSGQPVFNETSSAKDILDFMASIADSMAKGEDISGLFKVEGVDKTTEVKSRSQKAAIEILDGPKFDNKLKEDVASYLNSLRDSEIPPNSSREQLMERFINNVYEEVGYYLFSKPDARSAGLTWYIEDMVEFENKVKVIIPELSNEKQYKLFLSILAFTSSGTNPNQNLSYAYNLWNNSNDPKNFDFSKDWGDKKLSFVDKKGKAVASGVIVKETAKEYTVELVDSLGRPEVDSKGNKKYEKISKASMKPGYPKPTGYTNRGKIIVGQLEKLEKLYSDLKSIDAVVKWLETPHPIAELRKYNEAVPDVNGKGPGKTNKKYDPSKNADGERNGAFIFGEKIGSFYQNMIGIGETITMDLWWSRTWNRYMGTMINTTSGNKEIQEVPRSDRERNIMREAVKMVAEDLNLQVSELQAAIWYFEQELWTKSGNASPSYSYVTAIDELTEKLKVDEETRTKLRSAEADLTEAEKRRKNAAERAAAVVASKGGEIPKVKVTTKAQKISKQIKSLKREDVIKLAKLAGVDANWDMKSEGDFLSGKSGIERYTQRMLPEWNRASQLGEIDPNSKLTYDTPKGQYRKETVEAKDENGTVVGLMKMDTDGGILHLVVAPEFRGKGVSEKLYETLKLNNPNVNLLKTKNRSIGFEKSLGAIAIEEAYIKAREDKSNPELVNEIERLIDVSPEVKTRAQKAPKYVPESVYKYLTEDADGNIVFHHYSQARRNEIRPSTGSGSFLTSREEQQALSSVGGLGMYYTQQGQVERGVGDVRHTVVVPKEKIYYMTSDPLNLYDEARARFLDYMNRNNDVQIEYAFNPNYQTAWITKVAQEKGFDMVISKWKNDADYRAQSSIALKPIEEDLPMKDIEDNIEVGDRVFVSGAPAIITSIDENGLATYKQKNSSGKFDIELGKRTDRYGKMTLLDKGPFEMTEDGEIVPASITTRGQKASRERMMSELDGVIAKSRDRKVSKETVYNNALAYLQGSKVYEEADDVERESLVRELRKKLGLKEKSVSRIFSLKRKDNGITVNERIALREQIRLEAKAAKDAIQARQKIGAMIKDQLSGMFKKGIIKTAQLQAINRKLLQLNFFNQDHVENFINYMDKVFRDAEYADKLSKANALQARIKRSVKDKTIQAETRDTAKEFSKLAPYLATDIDAYIAAAEEVYEAVQQTKGTVTDGIASVTFKKAMNYERVQEYTKNEAAAQEEARKQQLLEKNKYLLEAGVLDESMSLKEMMSIIASIEADPGSEAAKDKQKIIRDYVNKYFDSYRTILEEIIRTDIDPFTGERMYLTDAQRKQIGKFLEVDLNVLSLKDAYNMVNAIDNFVMNQNTDGMEATIAAYEGKKNNIEAQKRNLIARPLRAFWSKTLGMNWGEQFEQITMMHERMFGGVQRAIEFDRLSGLSKLLTDKVKALKSFNAIVENYANKFGKIKDFNKAENVFERGMLGIVARNVQGSETEQQEEFNKQKKNIEISIKAMEKGTDKQKKEAVVARKVYDKILKDSNSYQDAKKKAGKENVMAVEFWQNEFANIFDSLQDVSRGVYNTILDRDVNYLPHTYKRFGKAEDKTDISEEGSAFMGINEGFDTKETGVLMKATKPRLTETDTPSRILSFDFDTNMSRAIQGALIDINTASTIRQISSFYSSEGLEKIIPRTEDRNMAIRRMKSFIKKVKKKDYVQEDSFDTLAKAANYISSFSASRALGSISQIPKQTISVAANTMINTGGSISIFDVFKAKDFIDNSGYGISIRGIASQADIQSINQILKKAEESKGKQALDYLKKLNDMYLELFVASPDVYIARASWLAYYKKKLKSLGVDTDNIDWSTHEINTEAGDYAQRMTDRQQNFSDSDLAGEIMSNKKPIVQLLRKSLFPFASFGINKKAQLMGDMSVLYNPLSSSDDKKAAVASLASWGVEMAVYSGVSIFIGNVVYNFIANLMADYEEDEEEKEKKYTKAIQYRTKNAVVELLSPIPNVADDALVDGINFTLNSVGVDEQYRLPEGKGEKLYEKVGLTNIMQQKLANLSRMTYAGATGTYVDKFGNEKEMSKEDQQRVASMAAVYAFYAFGFVPADFGTTIDNAYYKIGRKSKKAGSGGGKSAFGSIDTKIK
jgi:hypothetical protein